MTKSKIIKYSNVGGDAVSEHQFNVDQILKLDELNNAIEKFKVVQGKGAEFPTKEEQNLIEMLADNRILWPIVRAEFTQLEVLTPEQVELFDEQEEFAKYKSIDIAKNKLLRQMGMTQDFLAEYKGDNPAFLEMKNALEKRNKHIEDEEESSID